MSKSKITIWILGFITIIVTSYFYFRSNRFEISKEEGKYTYKIDRWTGQVWVLSGDRKIKVEGINDSAKNSSISQSSVSDSAAAIAQVKNDRTLDLSFDNDYYIRSELEDLSGNLQISGWEAEKIDDQTFLVTYKYKINDKKRGFYFEYNTKADIVREVLPRPTKEELRELGIEQN